MNTSKTLTNDTQTETSTASGFSAIFAKTLATSSAIGPLFVRLALAITMFPHGAQKLLGWWGGYGFEGTMNFFTQQMGIPYLFAIGAILVEFFAPLLLVAGAGTRYAALSVGIVLGVAAIMVQLPNGFFMNWFGNQEGEGIQFTLLYLGGVASLLASGAGRWSVDAEFSNCLS